MAVKLFYNIKELLTLKGASKKEARRVNQSDLSIIEQAYIITDNDQIKETGTFSDLDESKFNFDQKIDLKNKTVLPAFIDPHTHLVFAGDRTEEFELRNQGVSYLEISQQGGGIAKTVDSTRKASFDELKSLSQARVNNFLKQGVTTVEIKSGYGLDLETEIKILEVAQSLTGIRKKTTFLGPHSLPKEFKNVEKYFNHVVDVILPEVCKRKLCDRLDIFVEDSFFTLNQLKKYQLQAQKYNLDLTIHAEQLSHQGSGVWAALNGAISADHLVEAAQADIEEIAQTEMTCVLLPCADYYLQIDYPKTRLMIDSGCRVALGTDFNPGSSPTQDISFLGQLSRLKMQMTLPEVIVAMTLSSAYALGLQEQLGSLESGKKADFIVLDQNWTELFYDMSSLSPDSVWSNGERVV